MGHSTTRPQRPLGVWILTIYLSVMAGLLPLGVAISLRASNVDILGPLGLVFTVLIAAGVIVSAIGAWRASARSWNVLGALAILHYLGIAANNGMFALTEAIPEDKVSLTWARVIRSLFSVGIIVWYFWLSGRTNEFFGRRRRPADDSWRAIN